MVLRFSVHAPNAHHVSLFLQGCRGATVSETVMTRQPVDGEAWEAWESWEAWQGWEAWVDAEEGDRYWFVVDDGPPLLDPEASDLEMTADGPRSVVRTDWPKEPSLGRHHDDPVVYELHVRGFARTFAGCIEHLAYLADLGVNVIEVMPVHPFDPSDNYWGYMPLIWGAVHRPYAAGGDAPAEMAAFVAAAHRLGIEVWLDVVFNHTGEGDATMPTRSLRGLDDANAYLHRPDGAYNDDSGCGNVANPGDPYVRHLVMTALDRFADVGVDGFRFDLASLLTRDGGGLVERITQWAATRGVCLIAEPWDLAEYQVGRWPAPWKQWNDRFRDDVRGFVRGEPNRVADVIRRVEGSHDLFESGPSATVNFVTAHDGLTMHDLTIVTSDRHHSWDCGDELRMQQLKNYFTLLLLSAGTPMFVMGDEFARTQGGDDNPYNIDSPVTWVDWKRLHQWAELHDYVRALLRLRAAHRPAQFRFHGREGDPDTSPESRSFAWVAGGLYVMVNAGWDAAMFTVQEPGDWTVVLASVPPQPVADSPASWLVAPRSVAVWSATIE